MFRRMALSGALLWVSALYGCTVADEDRCPQGYFYVEEAYACCKEESHMPSPDGTKCIPIPDDTDSASDTSTGTAEPEGDGGADGGGDTDSVGPDWPTGLGEECSSHADCEGFDATFCLLSQVCTVEGCDVLDCPTDLTCCGPCAASDNKMVCVPNDYVSLASSMGCSCESD